MNMESFDVNKWVYRAASDLESAQVLAEKFRPALEVICYLCQQTAEKILKAYTLAKGSPLKKTHELKELLTDCEAHSADFDNLRTACARLTPFLTFARYPAIIDPQETHMKQAIKDAQEIMNFTLAKLREAGY